VAGRRLSAEEAEIWGRVTATVRALDGAGSASPLPTPQPPPASGRGSSTSPPPSLLTTGLREVPPLHPPSRLAVRPGVGRAVTKPPPPPADTLDGGWDRRLRRGVVIPDRTIDLHGHDLASAHATLDHALDRAVGEGVRVLLLVTGRAPKGERPHRRGLIRASVGDWLASSRHAGRIAAVRNAHPRHGGAGALYIILRRARSG
jgi:DNA-nicking Smr family endonuclease